MSHCISRPLIIAMIICVWGQQLPFTNCLWGRMEPSRRHYWFLFPKSPFWRLWPMGSWGNWLTGCAELEPTLCCLASAEGFVDCSQWSDLLWEQKGLTFCFILTYPRLYVYFVFHSGNWFLHSLSILFLCCILLYANLLPHAGCLGSLLKHKTEQWLKVLFVMDLCICGQAWASGQ